MEEEDAATYIRYVLCVVVPMCLVSMCLRVFVIICLYVFVYMG